MQNNWKLYWSSLASPFFCTPVPGFLLRNAQCLMRACDDQRCLRAFWIVIVVYSFSGAKNAAVMITVLCALWCWLSTEASGLFSLYFLFPLAAMATSGITRTASEDGSSWGDDSSSSRSDMPHGLSKLALGNSTTQRRSSFSNLSSEAISSSKSDASSSSSTQNNKKCTLVDFQVAFQNAVSSSDELTLCVLLAMYHSFLSSRELLALIKRLYVFFENCVCITNMF